MKTPDLDEIDQQLIRATQAGLPLVGEPYAALGAELGTSAHDVMARLQRLSDSGVIRRIGAVPNHYAIGYRANGMSVWDVSDAEVDRLGALVGARPEVTHCYRRPRHLPHWPYNLFAMLHGATREEVQAQARHIAALLGPHCHASDILFSTRILKKTGLRLHA
ncbi:MAG: siroheme decarboxylase subunit beta [Rhodoferax sp.]